MDDVAHQDLRLFLKELLAPWRVVLLAIALAFVWTLPLWREAIASRAFITTTLTVFWAASSFTTSISKRFVSKRYSAMWNGCHDRLARFEEVLKKLRRDQIANLSEMPNTIRRVGKTLYRALRRADLIASEVERTERDLYSAPPIWSAPSNDPQSKELYRIADKNIAEYRQQFAGVMAGVHRTEAQSAVYMTTLDTLRMKMLGYRLVGKSPEMSSDDFLVALAEARAQLQSIDSALEELDLGHYPKTISVVPPPMPLDAVDEIEQRLQQEN
ncbi:MAG: hypothetical protein H7Y17_12140 [Chlorobia bacterium]|nr:hypothetical protein [Fimbriimonadaceae bacterium]